MKNASVSPVSSLAQWDVIFGCWGSPSRLCLVMDATNHTWSLEFHGSVPCPSPGHPPVEEREGREMATTLGLSPAMGPTAIARSSTHGYCGKSVGACVLCLCRLADFLSLPFILGKNLPLGLVLESSYDPSPFAHCCLSDLYILMPWEGPDSPFSLSKTC